MAKRSIRRPKAIDTKLPESSGSKSGTPKTEISCGTPTPKGVRGKSDMRSPGIKKTPKAAVPDFITQTDQYGNASTPRTADGIAMARKQKEVEDEPGDYLLESIRSMCCCFLPEDNEDNTELKKSSTQETASSLPPSPANKNDQRIKLLPKYHPDDVGKKCLVLDLDETLVHSSFRAVPGADFVIPVQIEDVVHFVYVMKRPGVDKFLTEMAKYYEIVVYTASLNKYADPLLDLLDKNEVIRTRLFRESCVYYEGNYVKDLSLLDRDLKQSIIIDNSPSSYIFHPENAIDCSSFIDDPTDMELEQIGNFLIAIRDIPDVRNICTLWKQWPKISTKIEGVILPKKNETSK